MLILVFMKILSDLAIYYTFAAFAVCFFGLDGMALLPLFLLQGACLSLSWLFREKGRWRMLPALLSLAVLLWPGLEVPRILAALAASLYVLYLAVRSAYEPDWGQQKEVFSLFWRAAAGFCVLTMLFGKTEWMLHSSLPYIVLALTLSVMLTRSLRHEPQVYCTLRYQAVNALLVCAVVALALGSNLFLTLAAQAGQVLFDVVVQPLLTFLYGAAALVIRGIMSVVGWIRRLPRRVRQEEPAEPTPTPGPEEGWPMGEPVPPREYESSPVWAVILWVITILLIAALVAALFYFLSRRTRQPGQDSGVREVRERVDGEAAPVRPPSGNWAAKVRAQYRKFLKLVPVRALRHGKSDTSLDIALACGTRLDPAAAQELREIYIRARYDGVATQADARRARELYIILKKSV